MRQLATRVDILLETASNLGLDKGSSAKKKIEDLCILATDNKSKAKKGEITCKERLLKFSKTHFIAS